jgi:hypothetical protein
MVVDIFGAKIQSRQQQNNIFKVKGRGKIM